MSALVPSEAHLPLEDWCPNCCSPLATTSVQHCLSPQSSTGEVGRCGWLMCLVCHATVDPKTRADIPAGGAS